MLFQFLKWLHILLAITGVGANITYAIWIRRATIDLNALPFTLRGIKLFNDLVANPTYGFLNPGNFPEARLKM